MTARELATLGKTMRDEQARYFATKAPVALSNARLLERRFDAAVAAILGAQRDMWEEGQE